MNRAIQDERAILHARARAFPLAFQEGRIPPEPFDALAVDIARFQASYVEGYARLCRARNAAPASFCRAADAPAVPTDAFKLSRIATFSPSESAVVFRTSGTTSGCRGEHAMLDTKSYDLAALAFGKASLMHGVSDRVPVVVLGPSPAEAPDSSLTHMTALFVEHFGVPASVDETYLLRDQILDVARLDERIARLIHDGTGTVLLLGTSFAFVHLLDAIGDNLFPLPRGSRVMQTGGFKGRSRTVDADELRRSLASTFAIDSQAIVSEYGMTELSSQFYEATLVDANVPVGVYREPPWARVIPVDPETLAPVPDGTVGIARIEDLMNVDSAFAVLAADRVRRVPGGFELLGRMPGAVPRGCSLSTEELLGSLNPHVP